MSETIPDHVFDVEAVRRDFPILGKPLSTGKPLVYLDTGASAQKPQAVIDAERECYENYFANAYRGVYQFGDRVSQALEASRETVRALLNAASGEEIVFTSGTTMSINLVSNAWGRKFLRPGDEVLVTEMEHHANLVPWQQITREKGAALRYVPITADGRLDLDQLDEVLSDRTRLLAVTGMSNVLGTVNPIGELVRRAKRVGALVLVDGAQSVPHHTLDVRHPEIDFLAFSGHKLYGPTGVGVLYGRRELLDAMDPFLCGGHMIERVEREHSTWAELPAKFEAGTIPIAQAIALKAGIEYVERLGFDAIAAHERALLRYAHERLGAIPGLTIYGPAVEHKGSIVSFTVAGIAAEDLAVLLDLKGVFVRHGHHCTMPLHAVLGVSATVRASFGLYNTRAEVDALVEAIHFARRKLRLE
ncbi:MAG TPA: SufS family cysteine desulfurase [Planctomycetaceae bacterium]|nr:SufS family cysteine desulfurase [Planctomycetaceae bacterium]